MQHWRNSIQRGGTVLSKCIEGPLKDGLCLGKIKYNGRLISHEPLLTFLFAYDRRLDVVICPKRSLHCAECNLPEC